MRPLPSLPNECPFCLPLGASSLNFDFSTQAARFRSSRDGPSGAASGVTRMCVSAASFPLLLWSACICSCASLPGISPPCQRNALSAESCWPSPSQRLSRPLPSSPADVAVKITPTSVVRSSCKEMTALSRLSNPHIVQLFGVQVSLGYFPNRTRLVSSEMDAAERLVPPVRLQCK